MDHREIFDRISALPRLVFFVASLAVVGLALADGPRAMPPVPTGLFSPSNARTIDGKLIPESDFFPASRCASCHQDTHAGWSMSLHRNAAREPFYRESADILLRTRGIEFTRHCESCHTPVALFSGALSKDSGKTEAPFNTNDLSYAKKLLAKGADVNTRDKGGSTPLMRAAVNGNYEMARLLLDYKADVNPHDKAEWTALHYAAQRYDPVITKVLLEHGADPNAQDSYGNTTLARAVFNSRGRGEVINLLLYNGADPTIENKSGISPLKLAQTISNYDVKQYFK